MKTITSVQNEWIKNVVKLKDKKYSRQTSTCLVETYKIVKECLAKGIVNCVMMTQEKYDKYGDIFSNMVVVTESIASKLSSTTTHDGVFAIVDIPKVKSSSATILVLDHIQDPSNMGAIIRSACACNYTTIILLDCTYPFLPKTIRSSMGYVFDMHFIEGDIDTLRQYQKQGYTLYSADMNGENIFTKESIPSQHILVIGNEGNGLSQEVKAMVNEVVSIPMENGVESLNAIVSESILMYEMKNKIRS